MPFQGLYDNFDIPTDAMPAEIERLVHSEAEMRALGAGLIRENAFGAVVTLSGELGTGKTTLVRGALEAHGITSVRSPTYTLIEYYPLGEYTVAHFDLYRLGDAEELEFLGFRDYLNPSTLCLIEWPERAQGYLQSVDLEIQLAYHPEGRALRFRAQTDKGAGLLPAPAR